MRASDNDLLRLIAFHEAGHAVVGHLLGQRVTQLQISGDAHPVGVCHLQRFPAAPNPESPAGRAAAGERILCLIAGLLAEGRAAGRDGWDEASGELDEAVRLALRLTGDCEQALALLQRARGQAEKLLDGSWPLVVALAEALEQRRRLTADEVAEVMDAEVGTVPVEL